MLLLLWISGQRVSSLNKSFISLESLNYTEKVGQTNSESMQSTDRTEGTEPKEMYAVLVLNCQRFHSIHYLCLYLCLLLELSAKM